MLYLLANKGDYFLLLEWGDSCGDESLAFACHFKKLWVRDEQEKRGSVGLWTVNDGFGACQV